MTDSDAETVFDDESPLSPCLWTPNEEVENQSQSTVKRQAHNNAYNLPPQPNELQLSPASQLNVLSHISELADAPSRRTGAMKRLLTQQTQRSNMWGAALHTVKRKETSPVVTTRSMLKRNKNGQKSMRSQADRLATDMLDWETCSEGDLFTFEEETEEDPWIYQEICDSDFEDESKAS